MIALAFATPLLLLAVYWLYEFVADFKKETGSAWQRFLAAGKGSSTAAWAKLGLIASGMADAVATGADYFNLPEVQTLVQQYMTPKVLLGIAAVFAIGAFFFRQRTLGSTPPAA